MIPFGALLSPSLMEKIKTAVLWFLQIYVAGSSDSARGYHLDLFGTSVSVNMETKQGVPTITLSFTELGPVSAVKFVSQQMEDGNVSVKTAS